MAAAQLSGEFLMVLVMSLEGLQKDRFLEMRGIN